MVRVALVAPWGDHLKSHEIHHRLRLQVQAQVQVQVQHPARLLRVQLLLVAALAREQVLE